MSASIPRALAELGSVREDLEALTTLAGQVAVATNAGNAIDHQTTIELVARVFAALAALDSAEACLVDDAETESEVPS